MNETRIPLDHFVPDSEGASPVRKAPSVQQRVNRERFDLQDALVVLGFVFLVGGIAAIHVPTAFITAGLMFFGSALAIERAKNPNRSLSLKNLRKRKRETEE